MESCDFIIFWQIEWQRATKELISLSCLTSRIYILQLQPPIWASISVYHIQHILLIIPLSPHPITWKIYLWRKVVCLYHFVCLSCWDLPSHGASWCVLNTIGKPLMSTGLQQVGFHNVSTYVEQIIEYQTNFFSLKIHFNKNNKN